MANGTPSPGSRGRVIDADKFRAAREEANGKAVIVKFRGKRFTLPRELSINVILHAQANELRECITKLLGGEKQADEFFALDPSVADVMALVQAAAEAYGVDMGEALASQES